jgi:hypothetical protein
MLVCHAPLTLNVDMHFIYTCAETALSLKVLFLCKGQEFLQWTFGHRGCCQRHTGNLTNQVCVLRGGCEKGRERRGGWGSVCDGMRGKKGKGNERVKGGRERNRKVGTRSVFSLAVTIILYYHAWWACLAALSRKWPVGSAALASKLIVQVAGM